MFYKWGGILRFYEDVVRFYMDEFVKTKGGIFLKLLNIVIFSFLECFSNF